MKNVQELLRHANSRITLDVYTQAVNSNKRPAQSKVENMRQKVEENTRKLGRSGLTGPLSDHDLIVTVGRQLILSTLESTGGDDGARTRDLCRDRAAL